MTKELRGGGYSIDISNLVTRTDYNNQVSGLLSSIEKNVKNLSDSLSEEVDTALLKVNGNASITGDTTLVGLLNVTGDTALAGLLNVTGATTLNGNTSITGTNTFTVGTGLTTLGGGLNVAGNVGIKTTSPNFSLDVNGSVNVVGYIIMNLGLRDNKNNTFINQSDSSIPSGRVLTIGNATYGTTVLSGGNVGIGTTTPPSYAKLEVNTTDNMSIHTMDQANGGLLIGFQGATIQARTTADGNTQSLTLNRFGGNVGIGTMNPSQKLDVQGSIGIVAASKIGSGPTYGTSGSLSDNTLEFYNWTDGGITLNTGLANKPIYFNQNGSTKLMIQATTGNVGIGTTVPAHKLDILQTGTTTGLSGLNILNSGVNVGTAYGDHVSVTGASVTNVAGYFSATGATNNYGLIVANGNVGINTIAPGSLLDIKGGSLRLTASDGTYVGFHTAAGTTSKDYRLPTVDGSNGNVLQTDGSGNLSWTTAGGAGGTGLLSFNGSTTTAQTLVGSGSGLVSVTDSGTGNSVHTISFNPSSPFTLGATSGTTGLLNLVGTTSGTVALTVANTAGTGTWTFPGTTDTIVGRNTTDTFTNKTLTSPILTTPTLGVAIGTSLALGGATIGANALAVTGSTIISGNVGIGTTSPGAKLEVNGDALIHTLTVGLGGGAIATNTATGYQALYSNTTGNQNTANGYQALYLNTNTNNTANGFRSLYSNTTGTSNTANGNQALYSNTTGNSNTANGYVSLFHNTTGTSNTANGVNALFSNTTGIKNTANGVNALFSNTTGSQNTANGVNAFFELNITANDGTGNNTALGYNTGRGIITGINNTILGANVTGLDPALSNNIIIADGAGNQRIKVDNNGVLSFPTLVSCGGLQTNGNGAVSCTSDSRLKDIKGDFTQGLSSILKINPQTYSWKTDSGLYDNGISYSGFIAQNIEEAIPEAVNYNAAGFRQINTTTILATTVNAIKELDLKVTSINDMEVPNDFRNNIIAWFGNSANGINEFVAGILRAKDKLCIGQGSDEVCITKEDLLQMKTNMGSDSTDGSGNGNGSGSGSSSSPLGGGAGGGEPVVAPAPEQPATPVVEPVVEPVVAPVVEPAPEPVVAPVVEPAPAQ